MSFLDLDEWLFELARRVEVVYSPLIDVKTFPADVDLTLVEGAVANEDNLALIKTARANSKRLVSFGDCATTGNVTALRNTLGSSNADSVLGRAYLAAGLIDPRVPDDPVGAPTLLPAVLPVHAVVPVDLFLPGCPPNAARIREALEQLCPEPS
jgi:NAD-reducing hydrogenase small subunit